METGGIALRSWWSYLIRGVIALLAGILLLAWPASTVKVLVIIFGVFALVLGVFDSVFAIVLATQKEKYGLMLFGGLVSILIGALLVANSGTRDFTVAVIVVFLALWAIIMGFMEFISAFEMPPMSGRGFIGVGGVILVTLGILLLAIPLNTVWAIIIVLSIFLLVDGVRDIALGLYLPWAQKAEKKAVEKA